MVGPLQDPAYFARFAALILMRVVPAKLLLHGR